MNETKKTIATVITALSITSIGVGAKAIVDVEKMKVEQKNIYTELRDIKNSQKDIIRLLLKRN